MFLLLNFNHAAGKEILVGISVDIFNRSARSLAVSDLRLKSDS